MRTDAQRARHAAYMRRWRARRNFRDLDLGDPVWVETRKWLLGLAVAAFVYAASNGFWLAKP